MGTASIPLALFTSAARMTSTPSALQVHTAVEQPLVHLVLQGTTAQEEWINNLVRQEHSAPSIMQQVQALARPALWELIALQWVPRAQALARPALMELARQDKLEMWAALPLSTSKPLGASALTSLTTIKLITRLFSSSLATMELPKGFN